MLKIINISDRIIYIGGIGIKPNDSYSYDIEPSDKVKHKIENLVKLNLIRISRVDVLKVNTKKKSKK